MTDPIRIPVGKETPVNGGWHRVPIGEVFITPTIARQIVALAQEAQPTPPASDAAVGDDEAQECINILWRGGYRGDATARLANYITALRAELEAAEASNSQMVTDSHALCAILNVSHGPQVFDQAIAQYNMVEAERDAARTHAARLAEALREIRRKLPSVDYNFTGIRIDIDAAIAAHDAAQGDSK